MVGVDFLRDVPVVRGALNGVRNDGSGSAVVATASCTRDETLLTVQTPPDWQAPIRSAPGPSTSQPASCPSEIVPLGHFA